MPRKTSTDSKSSADKKTLNAGTSGRPANPKGTDRNQMQEDRSAGQFTGRGRPALQKK